MLNLVTSPAFGQMCKLAAAGKAKDTWEQQRLVGIPCAACFSTDVTGMGDPGDVLFLNAADYMLLPWTFFSTNLAQNLFLLFFF